MLLPPAAPEVPTPSRTGVWVGGGLALVAAIAAGVTFYPGKPAATVGPSGAPTAGEIRTNPKDQLPYVFIPPGTFRMGCASAADGDCDADEKPAHDVRITKGFWMGQTEVTTAAYKRFASATGKSMPAEPEYPAGKKLNPGWNSNNLPMTMVSWTDAKDYCAWVGLGLPSEAEWEYAARAGTSGAHYGALDDIAWYAKNAGGSPNAVGQKTANAFKLHDMLGNVSEWTSDWYKDSYPAESLLIDPAGPPGGESRVWRGGSAPSSSVRASQRVGYRPLALGVFHGFRCRGEIRVP